MTADRKTLLDKATSLITNSHAEDADKKLLLGRVPFVADAILQMFVEVCEEDPFGVDTMVKSLKKKLDAQGNLAKLHEIIKQERREIEDLLTTV